MKGKWRSKVDEINSHACMMNTEGIRMCMQRCTSTECSVMELLFIFTLRQTINKAHKKYEDKKEDDVFYNHCITQTSANSLFSQQAMK
jgi:hypothetical protein